MAVVGIANEIPVQRSASDEEQSFTLRRRFLVHTDSINDGPLIALSAPGIPAMGQAYTGGNESSLDLWVVNRSPSQVPGTRKQWYIDVDYDSEVERSQVTNPINEAPEITVDFELYKEVVPGEMDQALSPGEIEQGIVAWKSGIRNSAGEAYFPFPEHEAARPVVTFRRNEPNFSMYLANQYMNSVNQFTWSGLGPRQAWLRGIRANSRTTTIDDQQYLFYDVEYTFVLKRETWDLLLLDYGHYYISYTKDANGVETGTIGNPSTWSRVQFTTEGTGEPRIGLLDNSNPNRPGRMFANEKTATPTYNRYRVFKEQDFAGLNIFLNLTIDQLRKPRRYVR